MFIFHNTCYCVRVFVFNVGSSVHRYITILTWVYHVQGIGVKTWTLPSKLVFPMMLLMKPSLIFSLFILELTNQTNNTKKGDNEDGEKRDDDHGMFLIKVCDSRLSQIFVKVVFQSSTAFICFVKIWKIEIRSMCIK